MTSATRLQRVLAHCKKAGFIYKSSEGSEGLPAVQYYGPLGGELKRNLVNEWWHAVVTSVDNVFPLDAPIGTYRKTSADKSNDLDKENTNRSGREKTSLRLRSQLNHAPFYDVYKKTLKTNIPFGIAEIGKVFKTQQQNEGTLKNLQELEMGVVSFVCSTSEQKEWSSQWRKMRLKWWKKFAANPQNFTLGKGEGTDDLLGAIEFQLPEGSHTLETMVTKEEGSEKHGTCVITLSTFIDRAVLAHLCDSFTETLRPHNSKMSTVMRLDPCLAPYKVAVIPKIEDAKLNMYCKRLAEELRQVGISTAMWRNSYRQELTWQDQVGTPFRILGTEKTLEAGTVLLQDRDTTLEEEMNGRDVLVTIQRMLLGAKLK